MSKIRVLVLGTGTATKAFIARNNENEYIEIIGIILDQAVPEEGRIEFLRELNMLLDEQIAVMSLSEEDLKKADIVFSPEYRRIIPKELTEQFCFVNCHGGILPKWRGFSANAWAIMNGETEIGFSLHRVRAGLDDGEIYYVKRINIDDEQTYADVHNYMLDSIVEDTPKVLFEIANRTIIGIKQPNEGFAYCNRFTQAMGNLKAFEDSSDYYVNLWRCMARPLGTGVWFEYKEKKYVVNKVESGKKYGVIDYRGIPGKVVNISERKLWVKTKDNVVILSDIFVDGVRIDVLKLFKNGNQIGSRI